MRRDRQNERKHFEIETRVSLLESDIDLVESAIDRHVAQFATSLSRLDTSIGELGRELQKESKELSAKFQKEAGRQTMLLWGIFVSLATGAILLALDIAARQYG